MLAAALWRNAGGGTLHKLQQGLLNAFARHVTGDGWIFRLAADLVDFVDIDNPALGLLDIIIGRLEQFQDDIFDILADIAGFGQCGGVGHGERHVEGLCQRLCEQRLAAAGRTNQQDVRFCKLDIAGFGGMIESLVVIVHGHRQHALRPLLSDHIIVQHIADFLRRRHLAVLAAGCRALGFLANDVVAQFHAFIADEHRGSCDQLADFMLGFSAEGAI